ncbi:tetratricopeptide repeat protein, partial [Acinetobacter sp. 226]|uniref:tetratricopeptide repeat protein n=1 Tax=Acinetobacter sp. 226 TaxID=3114699 RepID=UPI003A8A551E
GLIRLKNYYYAFALTDFFVFLSCAENKKLYFLISYKMSFTVKDIAKTLRDSKKQGSPVIVFTGAGCSKSAGMPLASELIAEINKKFKGNLKDLTDELKKDYGVCMSKLTPHEQKTLIEKHISKAKINWAHIALASLLKNGYLGKVLTFNFDNILNRACSLDNFYPPTYDLKVLSEEYFSAIPTQSIVHLHGQWSGFQLANSDIDTEAQANKLKNYIKTTINTSPTLFIGYSGGADAFFKLVEEGFIGQHRLFWVDYAKKPNMNVKKFIDANPNHRNFIAEQDADQFLLELAMELKCFPTNMFEDPIKHMQEVFELINDFPLSAKNDQVDILQDTKKTLEITNQAKPAIATIKLAELLHHKKFDTIINQTTSLNVEHEPVSKILASAHLGKALSFLTKDDKQFEKYFNKAIEIKPKFYQAYAQVAITLTHTLKDSFLEQSVFYYEKCLTIKPNFKDDFFFGNYGSTLLRLAQIKEDEDLFKQAFEKYEKALKIQPDHPNNLGNYGSALIGLAQIKQDEELFKQAFEKYEKALKIQPDHAEHLGNYGNALLRLAQIKEDEELFKQAFEKYEEALKIQPDHAEHLGNYGNVLLGLARIKQDEELFKQAFEKYEKALKIQPDHPNNLGNYGSALLGLARIKQDEDVFKKALNYLTEALKIQPNHTYNLACYYALTNQPKQCKEHLLHAEKHNTLPNNAYIYIIKDKDLDNVRNEQWFIELLELLKAKVENN